MLLTNLQVAAIAGVSTRTVYRWRERDGLAVSGEGGYGSYINAQDLLDWSRRTVMLTHPQRLAIAVELLCLTHLEIGRLQKKG